MNKARMRAVALAAALVAGGAAALGTLHMRAVATAAVPGDGLTAAVSQWLGVPAVETTAWSVVSDPAGPRYRSHVPNVGLVQVDVRTHEVVEAIFDAELRSSPTPPVDDARATAEARRFAAAHFRGFEGLALQGVEHVDHGVFKELRATWRARLNGAWLPTYLTVGVNATSGRVAEYFSRRIPLRLKAVVPQVTRQAARSDALAVSGMSDAAASGPVLEVVVLAGGGQALVWTTELHGQSGAGSCVGLPQYEVLQTDALTGTTQVVARS